MLLKRLPELMSQASDEKRCKLLEGARTLQSVYCAILSAASVEDVALILREVVPEQRLALMERLPSETTTTLIEHLRQKTLRSSASKAAAAAAEESVALGRSGGMDFEVHAP